MTKVLALSHPEGLWPMYYVIRVTYETSLSHPDDIHEVNPMSSGWDSSWVYLIRMTYDQCRISSRWLTMLPYVLMRWDICWSLSHLDDLAILSISSGWLMVVAGFHPDYDVALCHPDEKTNSIPKSSGWLSYCQYFIWMTCGHSRMPSGWLTMLPYVIQMR